jgi:hypothetical protein
MWFGRLFLIVCVVILQISLVPALLGSWPAPNFIFAAVVVTLIRGNAVSSLWWAGVGGILLDLSLPGRGFYTLTFTALVSVTTFVIERYEARFQGLSGFLAAGTAAAVFVVVDALAVGNAWSWSWLMALVSQGVGIGLVWLALRLVGFSKTRRVQRLIIGGR